MLCQFIVKNYRSIKNEVVFDMQATSISEHKETLIIDKDGESYLPVSAIYGPNGSGKSNIIAALGALKNKVIKPICSVCDKECDGKNRKVDITPFLFDSTSKNIPTEFTVFFRTWKAEYRYVLHCLLDNVVYESLDKKNIEGVKYSSLFERSEKGIKLYGPLKKLLISDHISDNIPVISYLAITSLKNETVKDVISWFEDKLIITNFANPYEESSVKIPKDDSLKTIVINMLNEMDIDISAFRIEDEEDNEELPKAYSQHIIKGKKYEIPVFSESAGTKKILGFLPDMLNSLTSGTTLCVDEMDSKLHPMLIKYIIGLYTDRTKNKKNAQLIFTSHDLANMNNDVFRRDEIWFVAKNNEQSTDLYSLVEIKDEEGLSVRKDAKYSKQYLEGKYGADPFLKNIIKWEEL